MMLRSVGLGEADAEGAEAAMGIAGRCPRDTRQRITAQAIAVDLKGSEGTLTPADFRRWPI
jgi:hypothetical protein